MHKIKLSVIIPAYNEATVIIHTVKEITGFLEKLPFGPYELIIIDDHSCDDTFKVINELADPRITCIRLSRNSGSHVALRAGLIKSLGDVVLCMSADGQDNPAFIKEMLDCWQSGKKIVWALRTTRANESWFIRISAKLFYSLLLWLIDIKDIQVDLSRADFYLLDRKVVDAINSCPERNTSLFGLIAWLGFSQGSVEYQRRERSHGYSKWSWRNRIRLAKDWIIAFSGLPLKIVSLLGIFIAILGLSCAVYIVAKALFIHPALGWLSIPPWASIAAMLLTLGGIQMIILGVIGEYLWRNLDESRRRPLYFIESDSAINKHA